MLIDTWHESTQETCESNWSLYSDNLSPSKGNWFNLIDFLRQFVSLPGKTNHFFISLKQFVIKLGELINLFNFLRKTSLLWRVKVYINQIFLKQSAGFGGWKVEELIGSFFHAYVNQDILVMLMELAFLLCSCESAFPVTSFFGRKQRKSLAMRFLPLFCLHGHSQVATILTFTSVQLALHFLLKCFPSIRAKSSFVWSVVQ